MSLPEYEVFALRYARWDDWTQGDVLVFPDDHAAPMPLDFFIWVVRGGGHTFIFDTGYDPATGHRHGRTLTRSPVVGLKALGIDAAEVKDVVLSHLHWDHAGHWAEFPKATFHLQEAEMAFCTGRCMCHRLMRNSFDIEQVTTAVRHVFADRVKFHNGVSEIASGITLHLVGGHSGGLQIMRVWTARGWLVLASDAAHLWYNIRKRSPFVVVHDLEKLVEGWVTCEALADGPDHIIPGHDPEVLRRFPKLPNDPEIVQLHLPPIN